MIKSRFAVALACVSTVYAIPQNPGTPVITPAPVAPRGADSGFIGYYESSAYGISVWETASCEIASAWSTFGNLGQCCDIVIGCSKTDLATKCVGDYAIYPGSTISCDETCNTDYILASVGASNPISWIGCAEFVQPTTVYVQYPTQLAGGNPTAQATATAGNASPTGTTYTYTPPAPKKSYVWVAGVVVAGLAIIGGLALLLFFLLKKKRRNTGAKPNFVPQQNMQQQQQQPPSSNTPPPIHQYPNQPPQEQQQFAQPAPQYPPNFQQQQQQWAPSPSTTPAPLSAVSPMSSPMPSHAAIVSPQNTGGNPITSALAAQEQQYQDSKSPVGTVSEMNGEHAGPVPMTWNEAEKKGPNVDASELQ
ncbi:hypothetical protein G7Y89_g7788 [Cudoniella acicularis]|uniref:Uncharacterized protein n=1 Tax=Cudoniella acicularis TaxID=354080 RepID=A0A8H4RLD8_9HELO|nr:hypothetical protein G7Y89_g7788 [Cudoniella acicularis]